NRIAEAGSKTNMRKTTIELTEEQYFLSEGEGPGTSEAEPERLHRVHHQGLDREGSREMEPAQGIQGKKIMIIWKV
ncbi:MAG: hypothetical protein K6T73_10270, partial [Candidatus Bathyarchaeota archaeon]|nr:hypothetical protein [Candidatus Bathyarchaeota archaeon]